MIDTTQTVTSEQGRASGRGPAWWVVAVVAVIAVGLGFGAGYLVSPQTSDVEQTDVSAEEVDRVVALLDAYETAWNANDADAALALFTEDYLYAEGYKVEASKPALRRDIARFARQDLTWEWVGEPFVVGGSLSGGVYDVSALWKEWTDTAEDWPAYGISTYQVVDEDGVLMIRRVKYNSIWFQY